MTRLGRWLITALGVGAILSWWRGQAFYIPLGIASAALTQWETDIDRLGVSAVTYVRTMPARIVGRYYWYRLVAIWHLPPKLREQEMVRFGETKFAGDMVAAVIEALRHYAQRAAA